jgi:hypothetical protein
VKLLQLTKGQHAKVDDADFEPLSAFNWCTLESPNGTAYAVRTERDARPGREGRRRSIYLQRHLLNAEEGVKVLFADGDTLNCQRANIAVVTGMRYRADRKIRRFMPAVGFPGVHLDTEMGGYVYEVGGGNYSRLGSLGFPTAQAAADALAKSRKGIKGPTVSSDSVISSDPMPLNSPPKHTVQVRTLLEWLRRDGTSLHRLFGMDPSIKEGRLVFTRLAPWHLNGAPLAYPSVNKDEISAMRGWLAEKGREFYKSAVREAVIEVAWENPQTRLVSAAATVPAKKDWFTLSEAQIRRMTGDEKLSSSSSDGLEELL